VGIFLLHIRTHTRHFFPVRLSLVLFVSVFVLFFCIAAVSRPAVADDPGSAGLGSVLLVPV